MNPTIGISEFARKRHTPESGKAYYVGCLHPPEDTHVGMEYFEPNESGLLSLCSRYWPDRKPGKGETTLDRKVVIPLPPEYFGDLSTIVVDEHTILEAVGDRRQLEEDPFISVTAVARLVFLGKHEDEPDFAIRALPRLRPKFASAVLYSAAALLENGGTRSTDCEWEIVALIASDVEEEPMAPLTMARNFLQKPGGTFSEYTGKEFAEAIYYWSQRCSIDREQHGG